MKTVLVCVLALALSGCSLAGAGLGYNGGVLTANGNLSVPTADAGSASALGGSIWINVDNLVSALPNWFIKGFDYVNGFLK